MQRKTLWRITIEDGVAFRTRLLAEPSLKNLIRYERLVTSLESAATKAETEYLRRRAVDLRHSAEEDMVRLGQINKQLSDDLKAVERAQLATQMLDGIFRVATKRRMGRSDMNSASAMILQRMQTMRGPNVGTGTRHAVGPSLHV